MPIMIGSAVSPTDRSGTIASGGDAQVLMVANSGRSGFSVFNNSDEALIINPLGTASATAGVEIPSKGLYEAPQNGVPIGAISIYGPTTGQTFSAWEW